jgi:NADPH:quinone reductase
METQKIMKSIIEEKFNDSLHIKHVPIRSPKENEALVKLFSTTINPSDDIFLSGYGFGIQLPSQIGFEGFGQVTAVGSDSRNHLLNKKVSFWSLAARAWSEYTTVPVQDIMVMPDDTSIESGTFAYLNPITCYGLLDLVLKGNHKGAIITAAASQCGRILTRLCKEAGVKTINIVRREELKEICKENGADEVLISSAEDFEGKLKTTSQEYNATIAIDCIGGNFAAKILELMPFDSRLYLYGFLSGEPEIPLNAMAMLVGNKGFGVYLIVNHVAALTEKEREDLHKNVIRTLENESKTVISKVFTLDEINEALEFYRKNASKGKVLIKI